MVGTAKPNAAANPRKETILRREIISNSIFSIMSDDPPRFRPAVNLRRAFANDIDPNQRPTERQTASLLSGKDGRKAIWRNYGSRHVRPSFGVYKMIMSDHVGNAGQDLASRNLSRATARSKLLAVWGFHPRTTFTGRNLHQANSWRARARDPSLTAMLVVQCLVIIAPLAAMGYGGVRETLRRCRSFGQLPGRIS